MLIAFSVGNVWADPAAVGTTLFSEDFSSYSANNVPSGSVTTATGRVVYGGANVTYACTNGGGTSPGQTKIYAETLATGTSPEILVGKYGKNSTTGGTFSITGIPSGGAKEITVSYKQNAQKLKVVASGTGYTGSKEEKPSSAGTNSFVITVDDNADETFTLTFSVYSSNVRVDDILVTVKTAGEGGAPAKTLSSIAVSGTPTKTSYYAGDNFDPAGLTVTGTYSDASTAPITSGITWSYDPSQELALNQTSIGVIATVSEIASPKVYVSITVTEAPAAATYEKVTSTGNITDGDYLIVYEDGNVAFNGALTSLDAVGNTVAVTINEGVITGSVAIDAATVTISTTAKTIQTASGYYIGIASYGNGLSSSTSTAYEHQNISIDGGNAVIYFQQGSWNSNKNGKMQLCYNSDSNQRRFRYFKEGSQKAVQLYKKVGGSVKPAAGLAFETSAYLVKANGSLATPTLSTADGFDGTVTYASSDADVVAVNATTGALTIKAVGKAEITASSLETENFKAGSAKYTVYVAEQAGTAEDPLTEASAKALIDLGCTLNAHVNGLVLSQNSTTFTVTLTNGFQFYKAKDLNNVAFESAYLGAGDEVTAVGALKKYSSTYELDEGCYLTFYEQASTPLTSIANDEASAYTVAQALEFAANPTTYDLSDVVYVRGKVAIASTALFSNKYLTYSISDDGTTTSVLKVYNGLGIDGAAFTSKDDILVGDVVVVKGNLTQFNAELEFAANNELVSKKPVATIAIDNMELEYAEVATISATITPAAAASTVEYSIKAGSDDVITLSGDQITAKSVTGTATIVATIAGTDDYEGATKEFTVSVSEGDTRKVANSPATFTTTNGNLDPADIAFEAFKGGAGTAPANYNNGIRLYQISGSNAFGGYITLTAVAGCTIDEVQITTTSTYSTTVAYSKDGNENLLKSESVSASGSYTTGTGLNVQSVNIVNLGTSGSGRLEIASIKVYYTGEALTIDHYELGGTYATEFEVGDDFNHNGLIVYAAYDALGENKVDITSACTFSTPDMSTEGEKTIEITYKDAVVKSYTITVNASTDTRKIAESPATFAAVSGDLIPADITFASYKGGAGNDPYLATGGIRLYQISGSNDFGGFITLKAKKGCTIDQVKITTSAEYATTVAYSVDGNENLLGSESVAKSSDYSTPSGLNVESVNIVNKGTGSSGRLEIASIKVWYTGDPLAVDHYFLGGTYETTFEQNGTFDYTGLEVYAAYDADETITEPVEGFTVEADLSTAGEKKAEVYLNEVKIAEYDITVTAGKENPALAYNPASAIITAGDAWSAPTLNNTFNVSPITYSSDKESVATVDENGVIALAGGYGTAVITAHFDGTAAYIESEATYTITVNKPAPTPTSTVYRKVTATVDITDGEYLIVYEGDATHDAAVFDGSLDNVDQAMKALAVEIANDEIDGNTDLDAAVFTIDVTAGTLQSASGWYIGRTNYDNGMDKSTTETYVNTFAITDGAAVIKGAGNCTLRYNYAVDQLRFRYYKSGQQAIQLYKKETVTPPTPTYTEVRNGLNAGEYYTMCLDKAVTDVQGGSIWRVVSKAENGTDVILEEVEGTLDAGRPYIFFATATTLEVAYTGAAVGAPITTGNNGLVGSFSQVKITADAANYIIYNNELYYVNSDKVYVGANRAYLNMAAVPSYNSNEPQQGNAPRRRVTMAVHGPQVATGIDALNASDAPVKVLINGQLFIIRGEKMFDAKGQLVK